MSPGFSEPWKTSASSTSGCMPLPEGAAVEVKAEGLIKSTGRTYRQDYVVFLRAAGDKITLLREYFDPVRAAKALGIPILGLESSAPSANEPSGHLQEKEQ